MSMARRVKRRRALGDDPRLDGAEARFDGRTLKLTVLVNTDQDVNEVAERVKEAARGPGMHMAVAIGEEVPSDLADELWSLLLGMMEQQVKWEGKA